MFSTKPAAPTPAPAPTNTGAPDTANSGVQGMGGQPNEGQMPGTNQTPANPLDAYKKMFDNAANASGTAAPEFKLDPTVLSKVSSGMDFTKGVQPELVQKALAGDVASLMEVIKSVGQNSYRASIEHNTALTDSFINQRGAYEQQQLNSGVKQQLTQNELSNTPNYSHPVIKQELNRIAAQYARANPDASPQDIAKAAQTYINELHTAMNPATNQQGNNTQGGAGEMDWSKYLTS